MSKLNIKRAALKEIDGIEVIDSMTNEVYRDRSKEADEKIGRYNKEYAATYQRATLFSTK